ncbi:MAG TPA: hypothetical protein VFE36_05635 [Candidatus Baltobacteraceae bacterium]|nr:hypothetical protein [Candidatus Baltobacteraceae bacterium]
MRFVLNWLSGSLSVAVLLFATAAPTAAAERIAGRVLISGAPVENSTVTLWSASASAPKKVGETRSSADGGFSLSTGGAQKDAVLYVVAAGGRPAASKTKGENPALTLLALLGSNSPESVVVNELTTVASAFTAAQFINGDAISGNPLGLRIAAGNVPNFVNLETGEWGNVLLDPINSTQTATLATLDTLASLITATATVGNDTWRANFFKSATPVGGAIPSNALEAVSGIARESWADPKGVYAAFDAAYPQPKDGSRRAAPFVPYLAWSPPDFALTLCFAGGGMYSNGRFMFDPDGNLWSGQNWMAGSQSGVIHSIGGGVIKMAPNGSPLSPPITGFTGMGIDGVGWGTAVTRDAVWITSFNGKILVMDFDGHPIASESDFPFKEKLLGLMGIGVAANGDVWIADGSDNQLLYFPSGHVKEGRIVKVVGLKSPFDIVIDHQNRVWVSNSQSDTVLRFPADDPTKVQSFRAGISVRALALDSESNVWVASNASLDFPAPPVPEGASIMEQFRILGGAALKYPKPMGVISMIRPDGSQPVPGGFTGGGLINVPWGLNIDGNDDVWVGNFKGRSVVLMAGAKAAGHRVGTKPGDVLHVFSGGSIQMLTDVSIDPAGNVWAANNWNSPDGAAGNPPSYPTSTWGGGSGLTVIYGAAAPVKPPRMGAVQSY